MDAHDLIHRHAEQSVWISVPDVVLGGVGDILHIGEGLELFRGYFCLGETFCVKRDVADAIVHRPAQTLQLQGFQLFPGHGFNFFLPKQ